MSCESCNCTEMVLMSVARVNRGFILRRETPDTLDGTARERELQRRDMSLLLLSALVPLATMAFPFGPGGPGGFPPAGGIPPPPRELPPGFEDVLPADVIAQLKAIHENDNMPAQEKHEKIDAIMVNLPDDLVEKLPKPPGFDRLPQDVKDQLKAIHRDKSLTWGQRVQKLGQYIGSLPEATRRLLPPMGPPPPGPPPPGFGFPRFSRFA